MASCNTRSVWCLWPLRVPVVFLPLFLLYLLSCSSGTAAQRYHYPEEVHRMVLERLHRQERTRGGTWGEWSSWTHCSRSCGGGVSIQSRECLMNPRHGRTRSRRRSDNGGNRCVGLYKRFQMCNTQVCSSGFIDFRREQCASFNKTPFNRRFYTWEPYYDTPDSCALNCRAVGLSFYATLNQTVVDGTSCGGHGSNRICVIGRCMEVGCDGVLGSGLRLDSCGYCGGNNSTCRVIAGVFSRANMPYGYNLIATLPRGASNITIQHVKPSNNYLALRQQGGEYFLNGNWAVNSSGNYLSGDTVFSYQRPERYHGDKVTAVGPLTQLVDVMLFFQSANPGIRYEYRLPMSGSGVVPGSPQRRRRPDNPLNPRVPGGPASRTPPAGPVNDARSVNDHGNSVLSTRRWEEEEEEKKKKRKKRKKKRKNERRGKKNGSEGVHGTKNKRRARYEWKVVGFSGCTEECGGGTQTTRVVCVKRKRGNEVPSSQCRDLTRPAQEVVRCNLRPCPATWVPETWGPCSVTCGLGVQTRDLVCKTRTSPDQYVTQPEGACAAPPSVPKAQVCELPACDSAPAWHTGEWGHCSAQCGLGKRHRSVTCLSAKGAAPDRLCDPKEKPSNQELCDMGSCATDTWFFSSWEDGCSEECGDGVQRRRVHCSGDALDNQVTETSCDLEQRPPTTRACTSDRGCGGKWFAGPWGDCGSECGPGVRTRPLVCVVFRGRWRVTSDVSQCKGHPRPESTESCSRPCGHEWYTSEWSQCSAPCGSGVQRREVKCLDERQEPALDCTAATKPDTRQTCNTHSCHQEQADESIRNVSSGRRESPERTPESSSSSSPPGGGDAERKASGNDVAAGWRAPQQSLEEAPGFFGPPEDTASRASGPDPAPPAVEEGEAESSPAGRSSSSQSNRKRRPASPNRPGRPWIPGRSAGWPLVQI